MLSFSKALSWGFLVPFRYFFFLVKIAFVSLIFFLLPAAGQVAVGLLAGVLSQSMLFSLRTNCIVLTGAGLIVELIRLLILMYLLLGLIKVGFDFYSKRTSRIYDFLSQEHAVLKAIVVYVLLYLIPSYILKILLIPIVARIFHLLFTAKNMFLMSILEICVFLFFIIGLLVLLFILLVQVVCMLFTFVDKKGIRILDAFNRSLQITKGNRLKLFLFLILLCGIPFASILLVYMAIPLFANQLVPSVVFITVIFVLAIYYALSLFFSSIHVYRQLAHPISAIE